MSQLPKLLHSLTAARLVFVRSMKATFLFIALAGVIAPALSPAAVQLKGTPVVVISDSSIRINGIELRRAQYSYISLSSARRALGPPSAQYSWGAPIYVWRRVGVALQTGWRGAEKGRIFKFQVYFEPSYDRRTEMKSGLFRGQLQVDGINITPETAFQSIHAKLKNKGFVVTEGGYVNFAKKGGIEVFQAETTGKIARVDAWCP
jgi:hypothetical protein